VLARIQNRPEAMAGRFQLNRTSLRWIAPAVLVLLFYLVPVLFGDASFRMQGYEEVISFLVVLVALNVVMGVAGQFLIGITAIFSVGAYAAAVVAEHYPTQTGLILMCLIGGVAGGIGGLIIGLPSLRVGGFYLALVSLFAALVIPTVAAQWSFVGGTSGIELYAVTGFNPKLSGYWLYFTCLTILFATILFGWALVRSRVGHRFLALGSSEELASSLGISNYRAKLLAILISSVIAGIGGAMYVYTQQFFAPTSTSPQFAIYLLAGLVIGGSGTTWGPLIGGALVLGFYQFFTGASQWNELIFGSVLLVFAVYLPNGLMARLKAFNMRVGISPKPMEVAETPAVDEAPKQLPDWYPIVGASESGALRLESVRRAFGGVIAVNGVDLECERGTIHGLIGSNGSGKTTLLNLISGFYKLDDGKILVGDERLDVHPPDAATRLGISRTFQTPKLMFGQTALQNVVPAVEVRLRCFGAESVLRLPRGIRVNRQARSQALDVMESLGLHAYAQAPADLLPHGTQRLVELARSVAMRPSFVLLDEPAAGLSPTELDLLIEAIKNLASSGVGVLLIEHNVPMVLRIADRVTVMHQGTCIFRGTPDELRSNTDVASAFLGADEETMLEAPA
jgi:ABC-type branched-subunit amino acid transport system ATPase component/ABC-type branched-subunit amino acid transport system permease subunit